MVVPHLFGNRLPTKTSLSLFPARKTRSSALDGLEVEIQNQPEHHVQADGFTTSIYKYILVYTTGCIGLQHERNTDELPWTS